jgi:hypothetical protein
MFYASNFAFSSSSIEAFRPLSRDIFCGIKLEEAASTDED